MVYTTPHPDDDAQLAAWRRRQAEDAVRGINIRLPLGLARRLRAEAAERRLSVGRYVGDLLRAALGDLPGVPPPASAPTPPVPVPVDPGQVSLRDLRLIQLREGRDSAQAARQLDTADTATVLRLLRADLAWLARAGRGREA
jgi:hypothetical protein